MASRASCCEKNMTPDRRTRWNSRNLQIFGLVWFDSATTISPTVSHHAVTFTVHLEQLRGGAPKNMGRCTREQLQRIGPKQDRRTCRRLDKQPMRRHSKGSNLSFERCRKVWRTESRIAMKERPQIHIGKRRISSTPLNRSASSD